MSASPEASLKSQRHRIFSLPQIARNDFRGCISVQSAFGFALSFL